MDYTKEIEQAIEFISGLVMEKSNQIVNEELKDNYVLGQLLELLNNEKISIEELILPAPVEKNEPRVRLSNFLSISSAVNRAQGKQLDGAVFTFLLRNADEQEQKMYKSIFATKTIAVVQKEQAKMDKHQVNSKAISKPKRQAG